MTSGAANDGGLCPVPTLDALLTSRAEAQPDAVFLRFRGGDLSFAEVDRQVDAVAAGLSGLGVVEASSSPC